MPATLAARLDALRKNFAEKAPAEAKAVMQGATKALIDSGQAGRATGVGDTLPSFSLLDSTGRERTSQEFLDRGTLVLTFFRGHW